MGHPTSKLSLAIVPATIVIALIVTSVIWIPNLVYAGRVLNGVTLVDVDLSGTNISEARHLLTNITDQAKLSSLQLFLGDKTWDVDPGAFGLKVNPTQLANIALSVGRRGDINQRLYENWSALLGRKIPLVVQDSSLYNFNKESLTKYLETIGETVTQPKRDAKLIIKDNRATNFVSPQDGRRLDVPRAINLIAGSLLSDNRKIELPVITTPPNITLAETNNLGIKQFLAQGESDFSGSPANRRRNIAVGAAKFDGVIIPSGETFSFVKNLGDVDAKAGYLPELVIKGDKTTPEFGGGLCQVSTTAFRGILRAGLPIVERRNHSYRVVYYEPAGSDATIYQPSPDLKFTNDTPGSILIDTYIKGDKLFFDFYGTDTGRTIELDGPHIFNVTAYPEPIYIDTSTIPVGEVRRIDTAHKGADAVLYRKVFKDGKQIITDTFKSHYVPWPAKFLRGVEDAAAVEANLNNVAPPATISPAPPTT